LELRMPNSNIRVAFILYANVTVKENL